ncbi:MAG: metallophosphoesterase, partial [Nitrososphaerales archaeon]
MKFVQLCDLHAGPQFREDVFERAIEEVNQLEPDAVIITGDLTENGMLPEYEKAKEHIGKLRCGNIIVLSGNHDYRNTGYL